MFSLVGNLWVQDTEAEEQKHMLCYSLLFRMFANMVTCFPCEKLDPQLDPFANETFFVVKTCFQKRFSPPS